MSVLFEIKQVFIVIRYEILNYLTSRKLQKFKYLRFQVTKKIINVLKLTSYFSIYNSKTKPKTIIRITKIITLNRAIKTHMVNLVNQFILLPFKLSSTTCRRAQST